MHKHGRQLDTIDICLRKNEWIGRDEWEGTVQHVASQHRKKNRLEILGWSPVISNSSEPYH